MSAKPDLSRTRDVDPSDERTADGRSSLGRLAEFTRRILKVPKSDVMPTPKPR